MASNIRPFRKLLRQMQRLLDLQHKDTCGCCGVSLAQCHVLLETEEHGRTTIAELSISMGLDKSTLSRTVDGLVESGLVERIPHPTDRRYTLLALSEAGLKTCDEINRVNDDYFERVFNTIPEERQDELFRNFKLLVKAIAYREQKDRQNEPDSGTRRRERAMAL
jgi:DNA-binding MarR family transcriptional regulator